MGTNPPFKKGTAAGRVLIVAAITFLLLSNLFPIISISAEAAPPLESSLPSSSTPAITSDDITVGTRSANLTVLSSTNMYKVFTEEYAIWVDYSTNFVEYQIRPYFGSDYIRYKRANPEYAGDGTVDQYGNQLDQVQLTVTSYGKDGNTVWFLESCAEFSVKQSFNIYRDYFELNVTYSPGTKKVITTYYLALCSSSNSIYNLMNGKVNRYVPGVPELLDSGHGIGGYYPSFEMYAPACDMRVPSKNLGAEWGFSDTVAYIYSPLWLSGNGGGASVFAVKYFAYNSIVPNIALGESETFHLFCRPYKYTDGQDRGHDVGYAKWVAPKIASVFGSNSRPVFPLTVMNMNEWTSSFRTWVENSQVKLATYTNNPNQYNWNYKSSQMANKNPDTPADVPTSWQVYTKSGTPLTLSDGSVVCNPVSGPYTQSGTLRWQLINNDGDMDWWTNSGAVFWDEVNTWTADNKLRSDYQVRSDFVYDGYLRLMEESHDSGYWDLIVANSYTALLHLSIVADMSLIEGYEPSSSYNVDMTTHVWSTMNFVNNIPEPYRPTILVYQNYDTSSSNDQLDVYSALFGAAKYGYSLELLSFNSYDSQLHNLRMAEEMFKAMGCTRDSDIRTISVDTLDLSLGSSITTSAGMLVMKGAGTPSITNTANLDKFRLTNLRSAATQFNLAMSTQYLFHEGTNVQSSSPMTFTADGKGTFHGTITSEKTGDVIKNSNVMVAQHNTGSTSVSLVSYSSQSAKLNLASTGGTTAITLKGMKANTAFDIYVNSVKFTTITSQADGAMSFERSYGSSDVLEIKISTGDQDTVPPTISSCSPANGATGIAIGTTIGMTFSEAMNQGSVEAGFSFSQAGSPLTGSFSWGSTSAMTFTPSSLLSFSTDYVIKLSTSAKDLAGNALTSSFSSQFTTAASPPPPPPVPVPPSSPINLVASGGVRQISLTWSPPSDDGGASITGYSIYRSSTSSGPYSLLTSLGVTAHYDDKDLGNGATYYYRISAKNSAGEGALSTYASAQTLSLPSAPRSLSVTPSIGDIKLSWSPPLGDGGSDITGYKIYRGTSSGGETYLATVGTALTYDDVLVENGNVYYYVVCALNSVGISPLSNEVSAMPGALPLSPQYLMATPGDRQVLLTWEPPASDGGTPITSYYVYGGSQLGDMKRIATINATSLLDEGLTNGVYYYYAVSAINSAGEGAMSSLVAAKPFTIPLAPTNLSAEGGNTEIELTWLPPSSDGGDALKGYKIYRAGTRAEWTLLAQIGILTEYLDTGLDNGTTYRYLVTAVNGAGEGPASNEATATTTTLPPSSPCNFVVMAGQNSAALEWQAPSENGSGPVVAYNIYRGYNSSELELIATVSDSLSFLDQDLVNGQAYWYGIAALNHFMEGIMSKADPVIPMWLPGPPERMGVSVEGTNALISWTPPLEDNGSAVNGYWMYEWIGEQWIRSLWFDASTQGYVVHGLAAASHRLYMVRAVNQVGEGPGKTVEFTAPDVPSQPSMLMIKEGVHNITIGWSTPSSDGGAAITTYVIYRSEEGGPFRIVALVPASVHSFLDEGLTSNETYRYYVKAMNVMGTGTSSNVAQATVLPVPDQDGGHSTVTKNWSSTYQGALILSGTVMVGLLLTLMLYYFYRRKGGSGVVEWLRSRSK
jgi:fibronectin type 3 domain-containing protein